MQTELDSVLASQITEALRKGIPPQRGVAHYSVGNEKLIAGVKKFHLTGIQDRGIIRFVNGSWGAGKTHFFRLLREIAFENDCLVSFVELNANDTALNRFEKIFYSIVRNIATPGYYFGSAQMEAAPFGHVIQEAMGFISRGDHSGTIDISHEDYTKAVEVLFVDGSIDIDFKKMIQAYWDTYLSEGADSAMLEQARAEILQWFSGEGSIGTYRKKYGVSKLVSKDNAKLMLQSLAGFVRLAGFRGLLILFDEAEQAYSIMRTSQLRDAHNNLLHLINRIEEIPGLFMIYATTPDFFTDPKHGIVVYGALAGRIGKPEQKAPRALDTIWNFDAVSTQLEDYQAAAKKIANIYKVSFPEAANKMPDDASIDKFVSELNATHPSLSAVQFWRVMVTALITHFDDYMDGEIRPTSKVYGDVMNRLRED